VAAQEQLHAALEAKTHGPNVTPTRPDGDGSSLQNCDSAFNSSRVCHVGDAEVVEAAVRKTALIGFESRLSLHRRARSDGNAFLVPKNQRSGKDVDGGSIPPPSATTLKFLLFVLGSLTLLLRDDTSYPFRENAAGYKTSVRRYP